ncbi:thioredoxin family protein [Pontibacter pudoricolor]|uniref:thioredoxin family protein n=1 Tax=Pontibacter pudoricolor TaxID=2694930 RepID=UPI001EE3B54F|nr:thioredoxin family protein [Pontibacter pudoricolor]
MVANLRYCSMHQTGRMTTIYYATDADLRQLVFQQERVIVKFTDQNCRICKALEPSFEALARHAKYADVLFLKMDAKENPVSRKEVQFSSTPFIATYRKGVLKDCGLVNSEEEITSMLDKLLV